MIQCGRIRKPLQNGWTSLIEGQLKYLSTAALQLHAGQSYTIETSDREYSFVLVYGECEVLIEDGEKGKIGPRKDPFTNMPSGVMVSREEIIHFTALQDSLLGVGSSPAAKKLLSRIVSEDQTRNALRGADNWERDVRFVCWSDNTEGNLLITGETVTPSGNWSTIPPHRHQYDIPGIEVPYEEAYFFQFSKPQGFGVVYQFDDNEDMDQAFSLKMYDSLYIGGGYHPIACAPGADLYHITFIAGPKRISKSSVHKKFQFLLDEQKMDNPFAKQ